MGYNIKTTCICPNYINTGMFDGVKGAAWPFGILDQYWTVWRIVTAIRQEEPVVIIPFAGNYNFIARGIFPTWFCDFQVRMFGAANSMDTFKGRQPPSQ